MPLRTGYVMTRQALMPVTIRSQIAFLRFKRVTKVNYANGKATIYQYDGAGRATQTGARGDASVGAVYDANEALTGDYGYTPYGTIYAQAGDIALTDLPAAFTGKPLDPASGLYSFPYRIYSPELARWLSRDPLGMVDGPNEYGYVAAYPIRHWDVLGLLSKSFRTVPTVFPIATFNSRDTGDAATSFTLTGVCMSASGNTASFGSMLSTHTILQTELVNNDPLRVTQRITATTYDVHVAYITKSCTFCEWCKAVIAFDRAIQPMRSG
jgi:RHS repeat-associated protein